MKLEMEINTIYDLLIAIIPALTAVISVVSVAVRILSKFTSLKDEFSSKTDYKELQKVLSKMYDENMDLKKEIKRLQSQIDHVYRPEE